MKMGEPRRWAASAMCKSFPFLVVILGLMGFGCEAPKQPAGARRVPLALGEPPMVSLMQLIANPQDYDGQEVMVIGYLNLQFEGNSIWLHEQDYKLGITKNGLWIQSTPEIENRQPPLSGKYVLIKGRFNAEDKGHMGLWSGRIEKISSINVWNLQGLK